MPSFEAQGDRPGRAHEYRHHLRQHQCARQRFISPVIASARSATKDCRHILPRGCAIARAELESKRPRILVVRMKNPRTPLRVCVLLLVVTCFCVLSLARVARPFAAITHSSASGAGVPFHQLARHTVPEVGGATPCSTVPDIQQTGFVQLVSTAPPRPLRLNRDVQVPIWSAFERRVYRRVPSSSSASDSAH
jgi:hypothetical protein